MTTTRKSIHPLFDERSAYRLATRTSIWYDNGVESVRNFFLDRCEPTGAGGDELDQSIARFLKARQQRSRRQEEADVEGPIAASPKTGVDHNVAHC